MNRKPSTWLVVALMMFPQIVETIYSPVLPHIAEAFNVSFQTAAQTLSVYFIAFAFGVVFWGRMSDVIGRRRAMLAGLLTYGVGAGLAVVATSFDIVLIARIVSAFGAAVGSVVTQTMLRDSYQGSELGKVFSLMGMGIAISPVLGLMSGSVLASTWGYVGVFVAVMVLAFVLWTVSMVRLPETRPEVVQTISMGIIARKMIRDGALWRSASLVALFNLMLFGYYGLAPFLFSHLGLSSEAFGYSGIALALGSLLGSMLNKRLLVRGWSSHALVTLASGTALIGSVGVFVTQSQLWLGYPLFLLPMMLVVMGFGVAIPNILAHALADYKTVAGTAGALFGLGYYLMLGGLLAVAGMVQNLGAVLGIGASLSVILSLHRASSLNVSTVKS
ncbi:MFS transporter [Photobacterium frigidiphilum]|uniref:MFS transporter n=1 Tax=Photobacterium frigidiphilum TaxID=264736 RepID=A0A2T3JNH2_9GAMM|nr:multidrug effflux MFS transporter [Photobacterium frigidiphilum]PSU50585.1 MFS transporter [Photobacterium frigidiphilum]